ncbi:unnamed protein product [Prorocentrum cordatum]|uniref:Exodeoxyribonuclease X-like C-terminal domain-containing protein n=1 Tax=Prorocentrum cordatum TaxID=2364126 RepID=A0ABN9Y4N3_9DINO|nr:unnamed protein product [Polarella glacialis]
MATLSFGKHRGKTFEEVATTDAGYCKWVLAIDGPKGAMAEFQGFLKARSGGEPVSPGAALAAPPPQGHAAAVQPLHGGGSSPGAAPRLPGAGAAAPPVAGGDSQLPPHTCFVLEATSRERFCMRAEMIDQESGGCVGQAAWLPRALWQEVAGWPGQQLQGDRWSFPLGCHAEVVSRLASRGWRCEPVPSFLLKQLEQAAHVAPEPSAELLATEGISGIVAATELSLRREAAGLSRAELARTEPARMELARSELRTTRNSHDAELARSKFTERDSHRRNSQAAELVQTEPARAELARTELALVSLRAFWSFSACDFHWCELSPCESCQCASRPCELRPCELRPCDFIAFEFRPCELLSYSAGISACAKVSYSAGISACAKGEQWQLSLALLSEMWDVKVVLQAMSEARAQGANLLRSADTGGEPVSVKNGIVDISYSAGISACDKGEQWQRALALLDEMRVAELEPNVSPLAMDVWPVSYTAGTSACEKGEQWQRALALLSEMWEMKLEPNVISYSAELLKTNSFAKLLRSNELFCCGFVAPALDALRGPPGPYRDGLEAARTFPKEPKKISGPYRDGLEAARTFPKAALKVLGDMWKANLTPSIVIA